jgi:hypothetical protein
VQYAVLVDAPFVIRIYSAGYSRSPDFRQNSAITAFSSARRNASCPFIVPGLPMPPLPHIQAVPLACDHVYRRHYLVSVRVESGLDGFAAPDVIKALCQAFPAFCRVASYGGFVRQLLVPCIVSLDMLAAGFIFPFGFCENLATSAFPLGAAVRSSCAYARPDRATDMHRYVQLIRENVYRRCWHCHWGRPNALLLNAGESLRSCHDTGAQVRVVEAWPKKRSSDAASCQVHLGNLRRKPGENPGAPQWIVTVRGCRLPAHVQ